MSTVADEFAARFDAALRIKTTDKAKAAGPYDRLNEFVRKLQKLADVDSCLTKYLVIYVRYANDDPRSEMIFAMLAERRIKLTPQDDDFVDALYDEVFGKKRPLSKIAARTSELEVNRHNGILKELKEARNQRQTSGSIIDPLRQMYRRAHDGQPAQSIAELYEFNPLQDDKLEKEYRQVVVAVWTTWGQAEKQFASRNYGYDDATRASEAVRLQSTGYAGFKKRFEDFAAFLDDKRADDRALFQLLKWSRDVLLPHTEIKGRQTQTRIAAIQHLDHEIYLHIVFAIYLNAVQQKHFVRKPEGFTAAEQAFFLDPLKPAPYYSNFLNRLKLVFPSDGHLSNVPAFTALATLYSQLILFARSQHLELVSDKRALEIQAIIEATPWLELVTRRFSTVGMPTWAYAQDTFGLRQQIGTDIRIAYFEGTRPKSVYLQLDAAPGFLFEASLSAFVEKVETGLYKVLWENNKGLIVLMQKFFEVIGYLPVLVEAGFVGLIKQVVQDQLIAAGLDEASEAFGVDLSSLGMVLPLVIPHKSPSHGTLSFEESARAELAVDRALARENTTANKALATMTGDEAKLLNRLTPASDAGVAKVVGGALTQEEGRAAKVIDTTLAREEQRTGKLADRPLTDEERRMAKLADRPLTDEERRMAKAIERHLNQDNDRMAGAQARATDREVKVAKQAQASGVTKGEHVIAQAEAAGGGAQGQATGALQTQAAGGRGAGGPRTGSGSGSGTGGSGSTTGGGGGSGGGGSAVGGGGGEPRLIDLEGRRRMVEIPKRPKAVEPPVPVEPPKAKRAGYTAQDEVLHEHVLEILADQMHAKKGGPTSYLGVHDPVTVDGKRYGGGNRMDAIAEKLHDASDLRAQARKPRLDISHNPHELEIDFINRYPDLKAEYKQLDSLTKFLQVDEYEHLAISPKRKLQIRDELDAMHPRKVGALKPDMLEVYFDKRLVEIADITLTENDPYHRFKTKVYKRIMEEMLPGFKVIAYDIKPKPNGLFMFSPVD